MRNPPVLCECTPIIVHLHNEANAGSVAIWESVRVWTKRGPRYRLLTTLLDPTAGTGHGIGRGVPPALGDRGHIR